MACIGGKKDAFFHVGGKNKKNMELPIFFFSLGIIFSRRRTSSTKQYTECRLSNLGITNPWDHGFGAKHKTPMCTHTSSHLKFYPSFPWGFSLIFS